IHSVLISLELGRTSGIIGADDFLLVLARYAAHPRTRSNLPPSWYTRLPGMWQDNAPCAGRTVADFHQSRRMPIQVRVRRGSRLHNCATGVGRLSWRPTP